ncbi:STAS domain-containing protein [Streptomyces scabiei]|uniref:STAS domain-containing protein n=1 Tax=Streptomyces scabiei TaxID=1930 RepID=UPI0033CB2A4F
MDIDVSHEMPVEGVAVVRTVGELDVYTTPKWRGHLLGLVRGEGGPRHVGLDFSAVDHFDSTAIGCLVLCWREHRDAGGADPGVFALFSVTDRTGEIMRITGLERVVTVAGSLEEFLDLVRAAESGSS